MTPVRKSIEKIVNKYKDIYELQDELSGFLDRGSYSINFKGKQYSFDIVGLNSFVEYGNEEIGVKNFKEIN